MQKWEKTQFSNKKLSTKLKEKKTRQLYLERKGNKIQKPNSQHILEMQRISPKITSFPRVFIWVSQKPQNIRH